MARLELTDACVEVERQAHLVPAGQKQLFTERVNVESVRCAIGTGHRLRLEVHGDRGAGALVELPPQAGDDCRGQDHG